MTTRFHKTVVAAVVAGFMLSGCSQLSPEEKAENGYSMLEKNDLRGAEIDYQEGLEGAQFVIKNPNAKTTCGCGSSFST